jgi:flagella basal body P-ring formation protein FlgA
MTRRCSSLVSLFCVALLLCAGLVRLSLAEGEARRFRVPEEKIRELAEHFLFQKAKLEGKDVEVQSWYGVRNVFLPTKDGLEVVAEFSDDFAFDNRASFTLCFRSGSETLLRLEVRPAVRRYESVVVARRSLAKGDVLGPADVGLVRSDMNDPSLRNVLQNPQEAVGKRLRMGIPSGAPIGKHVLEDVVAVNVGDEVDLLIKGAGYQIHAKGTAKQKGILGDEVEVMNSTSKKVVKGRVVGLKQVRVSAP